MIGQTSQSLTHITNVALEHPPIPRQIQEVNEKALVELAVRRPDFNTHFGSRTGESFLDLVKFFPQLLEICKGPCDVGRVFTQIYKARGASFVNGAPEEDLPRFLDDIGLINANGIDP